MLDRRLADKHPSDFLGHQIFIHVGASEIFGPPMYILRIALQGKPCPAVIFYSGSVLLNRNVNGCVHTYVNHSRTVVERWPNGSSHKIGSGLVRP